MATMALDFFWPKLPRPKGTNRAARPADVGIFRLVAELRDAAHDDGIHAQKFSQFGRGGGIGAIAVGKVLLRMILSRALRSITE